MSLGGTNDLELVLGILRHNIKQLHEHADDNYLYDTVKGLVGFNCGVALGIWMLPMASKNCSITFQEMMGIQ